MLFHVTHTTRYTYQDPVSQSLNEVHLTPRSLPDQHVSRSEIRVEPAPSFMRSRKDYFGNDVASFGVFERHDLFLATAESIVDVQAEIPTVLSQLPWEAARDLLTASSPRSDDGTFEASEFLYNSPYVSATPELAEYARSTFPPGRPLLAAASELSHRIHTEFKYHPKSTSIDMPLNQVLRNRRGVCQDFAHIMIGALRSLRLSARYVSGYVRPGPKVKGAQASHAWVSIFVPGSGWFSFDPTNDVMPTTSHITLAWGRDYGDVTPVKGVTLGGAEQTIEVEVYVKPLESPN